MNLETLRAYCLALPHVTEKEQWGDHLLFCIGGKMFAVTSLDPAAAHCLSFKCTPEEFAELTERAGVVPAPYMARNKWAALERFDALPAKEIKRLVKDSYELVKAKLPKKLRVQLEQAKG